MGRERESGRAFEYLQQKDLQREHRLGLEHEGVEEHQVGLHEIDGDPHRDVAHRDVDEGAVAHGVPQATKEASKALVLVVDHDRHSGRLVHEDHGHE